MEVLQRAAEETARSLHFPVPFQFAFCATTVPCRAGDDTWPSLNYASSEEVPGSQKKSIQYTTKPKSTVIMLKHVPDTVPFLLMDNLDFACTETRFERFFP